MTSRCSSIDSGHYSSHDAVTISPEIDYSGSFCSLEDSGSWHSNEVDNYATGSQDTRNMKFVQWNSMKSREFSQSRQQSTKRSDSLSLMHKQFRLPKKSSEDDEAGCRSESDHQPLETRKYTLTWPYVPSKKSTDSLATFTNESVSSDARKKSIITKSPELALSSSKGRTSATGMRLEEYSPNDSSLVGRCNSFAEVRAAW